MVTIERLQSSAPSKLTAEVNALRAQFLREHENELSASVGSSPMVTVLVFMDDGLRGYAIVQQMPGFNGAPALWVEEVFVAPESRHKGCFKAFVQWIADYQRITGTEQVLTKVWNKTEYQPWAQMGAESKMMVLNLSNLKIPEEVKHERETTRTASGFNGESQTALQEPAPAAGKAARSARGGKRAPVSVRERRVYPSAGDEG